jgi:hypothetical protein
MKKHAKLLLLPLFVLGFFAMVVIFNGCKKAAPSYTCSEGVDDGCGDKWEACCNTVQCYYSYKGKKYNCNGTDCGDAALKLIGDIDCTAGINLNTLTKGNSVCELLEVVEMLQDANQECLE